MKKKLMLACGALLFALIIVEVGLRLAGLPQVYSAKQESPRFSPTGDELVYVNHPGRITFTYDGNPRGYFGVLDEVNHQVNQMGFRGRSFGPKTKQRLVFLGDSFTFGEGVRDDHTFAEFAAGVLKAEVCNLGVGGYNTTQALTALKVVGLGLEPDAVILGYVPNDAEPPLFTIDAAGNPVRRDREAFIEAETTPPEPPSGLRISQLIWQVRRAQRLGRQTVSYYQGLYAPENEGWQESKRALREIIVICREREIPCVVLMFPVLVDLDDSYPFAAIHEQVGTVVQDAGGIFVDLLPALKGKDARTLWVHPTDQHPNEQVHAIAGELVAQRLGQNE